MKRESMKLTLDFPEGLEGGGSNQKTLQGYGFSRTMHFGVLIINFYWGY